MKSFGAKGIEQRFFFYKQGHIETRTLKVGRVAFRLEGVGRRRVRAGKST